MALVQRQKNFVLEYLKDLNATQAALRCGYSKKSAHVTGCQLLKDPKIRAAIDAANAKRTAKLELSAESVLADIERIARTCEASGDMSVALRARELIGKHLRLFVDRVEHSGDVKICVVDPYAEKK